MTATRAGLGTVPAASAPLEARSRFVHGGFAASARGYDRLTCVFSFGLDRRWRRAGLRLCALRPGQAFLDVATGTGALVIEAERILGEGGVAVGLDFCAPMLHEAGRKLAGEPGATVNWIQGRAEAVPFRAESFDRITVGFALRHVDLDATLREIARVLKPDGRFVVVEWTRPEAAVVRRLLLAYMRWIVPPLVGLISRNRQMAALARYLPASRGSCRARLSTSGSGPRGWSRPDRGDTSSVWRRRVCRG